MWYLLISFDNRFQIVECADLERFDVLWRSVTGLARRSKCTRIPYKGEHVLNIVDTPGHADFGGEVRSAGQRGLPPTRVAERLFREDVHCGTLFKYRRSLPTPIFKQ